MNNIINDITNEIYIQNDSLINIINHIKDILFDKYNNDVYNFNKNDFEIEIHEIIKIFYFENIENKNKILNVYLHKNFNDIVNLIIINIKLNKLERSKSV